MTARDAEQALKTAKALTSRLGPKSSVEERRQFQEHLISLCSYPSYEAKAYFGTFVFRNFAEFEDLQDGAVDALLDLCEDEEERVRIIGVKGLGTTGKAEPRWVRGNTGVLLQLLECPPRELEHVRTALSALLSVSPADVFAVMVDDCKGSEEETGASRRNILDFLEQTASVRELLESGQDLSAEEAFKGFYDALGSCEPAEQRQILGMLASSSTITGKNATEGAAAEYASRLTTTLREGSSTSSTTPLIRLFAKFLDRTPPLNPQSIVGFLAAHGGAVVSLALEKVDKDAVKILDQLKLLVPANTPRGKVAADFVKAILPEVLSFRFETLSKLPVILENLMVAVYRTVISAGLRKDIKANDARKMLDFAREADRMYRKHPRDSPEGTAWRNIRNMLEILGDPREKTEEIAPSWLVSTNVPPSAPRVPQTAAVRPPPSAPSSLGRVPNASSGPKPREPIRHSPPRGPKGAGSSAPPPPRLERSDGSISETVSSHITSASRQAPPAGPRRGDTPAVPPPNGSQLARVTSSRPPSRAETASGSSSRPPPTGPSKHRPAAADSRSDQAQPLDRPAKRTDAAEATQASGRPTLPQDAVASAEPTSVAIKLTAPAAPTASTASKNEPPPTSEIVSKETPQPKIPVPPPRRSLAERLSVPASSASPSTIRIPDQPTASNGSNGVPSLQIRSHASSHTSIPSVTSAQPAIATNPRSLKDRLGPSLGTSSGKRSREDLESDPRTADVPSPDIVAPTPIPSLRERMSAVPVEPAPAKRPRPSSEDKPSLLDRLSKPGPNGSTGQPPSSTTATLPSLLSQSRTQAPELPNRPSQPSLNIKNHSNSRPSPSPSPMTPATPAVGFRIRGESVTIPQSDEEVVVQKKGRGFRNESPSGDIIMVAPPVVGQDANGSGGFSFRGLGKR